MYNLISEDWGRFLKPWVEEIGRSFRCLKVVHFRRMIVTDEDLMVLGCGRGEGLQVLKLDKCSGFSNDGLLHISRSCMYWFLMV
ncbi:putative leucine-rich repeat domain superfamily, transport inhibitor response 1 [Helianthus anomalus]